MRRARRERYGSNRFKILTYIFTISLLVVIITFAITYIIYKKQLNDASESLLTADQVIGLVPNEGETEQASTELGKTIEEAKNTLNLSNTIQDSNIVEESDTTVESLDTQTEETSVEQESTIQTVAEEKEPEFVYPVEGEKIRDFAKESLVYSNTLQEWITHLGIDIKADRTTVVKSAEAGTVTNIKNDPRYGLTIVIEHTKGYKTVYSNLLTTEFVEEGEVVEKGQSIGTVGNSAAFEIADEPHLHFEILKDNENVDPNLYL